MKYGPNTTEVERILEQVRNLTDAQTEQLGAAWESWADGDTAFDAAWDAAFDATWGARDATWGARGAAWGAKDAIWGDARDAAWNTTWEAIRESVWNLVWSAVLATMAKGMITEDQYETLSGPWRSMMD